MKSIRKVYKIGIGFFVCMLLGVFIVLCGNNVFARTPSVNPSPNDPTCNNKNGYKNWYENGNQGGDDCCGNKIDNVYLGAHCS